jgi:hypothetical protein
MTRPESDTDVVTVQLRKMCCCTAVASPRLPGGLSGCWRCRLCLAVSDGFVTTSAPGPAATAVTLLAAVCVRHAAAAAFGGSAAALATVVAVAVTVATEEAATAA